MQVIISINMTESASERRINNKADPAYRQRLEQAAAWVNSRRGTAQKSMEELVTEACVTYEVEFNDVWERIR